MGLILFTIGRVALLWLLTTAPQGEDSTSVTIIPGSESHRFVQGTSEVATVQVTAGEASLNLRFKDGKLAYGYLFWLRDPDSRVFLWGFQYDGERPYPAADRLAAVLDGAAIHIFDSTLNYFSLSLTGLLVQKSDERFATTEDGVANALQVIEANLPKIPDESFQHTARRLPLRDAIPVDFFYEPLSVAGVTASGISSIRRQGDGWRVELEGEGSRRAVVLLDSNLELVEAKEVKQ